MQTTVSCELRLLDRESLTYVCSMLDPVTVANLSCTCRDLRDVSFQDCLWERFSRQKWKHLNTDLYARAEAPPSLPESPQGERQAGTHAVGQQLEPSVSYRSLYTNNNGWTPLNLQEAHTCPVPSGSLQYCVSRVPASTFCEATGDAFYTLRRSEDDFRPQTCTLSLWSTGDCSQAGCMLQSSWRYDTDASRCITELAAGILAVGAGTGKVFLHDLRPEAAASTQPCATWWSGNRGCVLDMKYCPYPATLYALQEMRPARSRSTSYLQKWDFESGRAVAEACEVIQDWDLSCFCVTDQDSGGNEVIVGAVSEPCEGCSETALPTLCCHKSAAKAASLCVFDTRAGMSMVQQYSIHHGSLYPVMPCARGNYLFTSHFGTPLAVWDKRQMSHVVYEEQDLGNFPKSETYGEAEVPLALPTEAASHQGLYLSTDGDQLVGRAENGMVWLWDLAGCLGWQQGGPVGSWLQDTQVGILSLCKLRHMGNKPFDNAAKCVLRIRICLPIACRTHGCSAV
ncbi:hypothetical protein ABBQ38_001177 [Trebouxia sp. C0009 RCD-2024]